ncbi:MAG: dephospho-CoA kinase [Muribaculaceae bacterium]|nr:dephospho-CoA kinase [Muribaculaceae bacterium]
MNRYPLIAITGGIGSGKSVVSQVLRVLGYDVFDSDSEAKALMDADQAIHRRLCEEIDSRIVSKGVIDRRLLASIVFADEAKLGVLNSIVHSSVKQRLADWHSRHSSAAFVETAILYESGLNAMVDREWRVESPLALRIERTMKRSNLSREEVEARIASQSVIPTAPFPALSVLVNDERSALCLL